MFEPAGGLLLCKQCTDSQRQITLIRKLKLTDYVLLIAKDVVWRYDSSNGGNEQTSSLSVYIIIVIVFASIGNVRAPDVLYFILLIHRPIKSNDYHGMCE